MILQKVAFHPKFLLKYSKGEELLAFLVYKAGEFVDTSSMPALKIYGGHVNFYEAIIPNNLVKDVVLCCGNSII